MILYNIIVLTVIIVILGKCFTNVFPAIPCETRLTYLYTTNYVESRMSPNGSHKKWWGYASKWAHPP